MTFDLIEALSTRLKQQQKELQPLRTSFFQGLQVELSRVHYQCTSRQQTRPHALVRVRSRNRTDWRAWRLLQARVLEDFSIELNPIHWLEPLQFTLPAPPGVERPNFPVQAGSRLHKRHRRVLSAKVRVPPHTELISELGYRPLICSGQLEGELRVSGRARVSTESGALLDRLVDERFTIVLGSWESMGVEEVLVEDRDAVETGMSSGRSLPISALRFLEPGLLRWLAESGLESLNDLAMLPASPPNLGLLSPEGQRGLKQACTAAVLLEQCPALEPGDALVLAAIFYVRNQQDLLDLQLPELAGIRLLAARLGGEFDAARFEARIAVVQSRLKGRLEPARVREKQR
jgi:hypothetical protein